MARVEVYRYEAVNGTLPRICLVCGAPAPFWVTRRVSAFAAANLRRILLILYIQEIMKFPILEEAEHIQWCRFPFCHSHKTYWLKRELCAFGSLVILVVGSIVGLAENSEAQAVEQNKLAWLFIGLLAGWGILTIMGRYAFVHVVGWSHTRLAILHVSGEFVAAIAERRAADERDTPPPLPPDDNPFSGLGS